MKSIIFLALLLLPVTMLGQVAVNTETDVSVDENTLKSYVGRYDYGQGAVLIVTLENHQLNAQLTGQQKFPIFPRTDVAFYWKVVDANVTFVTNTQGIVTHAVHNQNGMQFEARKLPDEKPVNVDPAVFDKYVGRYDIGNGNFAVISKEGDKLFAQGPNLPRYQLLPASETEYFLREINARLKFTVNDEGKTTFATINMAGEITTSPKISE